MQLSRAVLYLPVLACLPASLTARLHACACVHVRAYALWCAFEQVQARAGYFRRCRLLHSVLVVAYACCSIHKRIETCGGTNATLHVGVEDRACKTMRMCIGGISAATLSSFVGSLRMNWIGNVSFLTECRYFQSYRMYRLLNIFRFCRLYLFLLYIKCIRCYNRSLNN